MRYFLIAALLAALWTADAQAFGRRGHGRLFHRHRAVGCATGGCSSCR